MKNLYLLLFTLLSITYSQIASAQWVEDTDLNTIISDADGAKYVPKVAVSNAGIYYISWFGGSGNLDMNLQALDFNGNELWQHNGIAISEHVQNSSITDYDLTTDSAGNAVIAFTDIRTEITATVVYKVSPEGEQLYGEDGIFADPDNAGHYVPHLAITPNNSVVVSWMQETETGLYSVMQKFDMEGNPVWGSGVSIIGDAVEIQNPVPLATSDGGILLVYYMQTGPFFAPDRAIYAMKYDAEGEAAWTDAVEVCGNTGIPGFATLQVASDGADGAIVTWYDDSDQNSLQNVAVQHVYADGALAFETNGLVVGNNDNNTNHLGVVPAVTNENGDIYVFWTETNSGQSQFGLRGQKINSSGELLWGENGLEAISLNTTFTMLNGLKLNNDTCYIVYETHTEGQITDQQILVKAVDSEGEMIWAEDVFLATSTSEKIHVDVAPIFNNQLVVAWEDSEGSLKAQNLIIGDTTSVGIKEITEPEDVMQVMGDKIKFIQPQSINSLHIYDVTGKLIQSIYSFNNSLDMKSMTSGLYIVVAYDSNNDVLQTEKVVVQ